MCRDIFQYCQAQNKAVEQLNNLVSDLPDLNQTLETLITQIGKLGKGLLSTMIKMLNCI